MALSKLPRLYWVSPSRNQSVFGCATASAGASTAAQAIEIMRFMVRPPRVSLGMLQVGVVAALDRRRCRALAGRGRRAGALARGGRAGSFPGAARAAALDDVAAAARGLHLLE